MIDKNSSREDVIKALKSDGMSLANASDLLKKDLEIIGLALKQNPKAFQYIHQDLLKDTTYAPWFLANSYLSFQYFPEVWRDDEELALTALSFCEDAEKIFLNLSKRLKESKEFYEKAAAWLQAVPDEIRLSRPYLLAFTKLRGQFNKYYPLSSIPADFILDEDLALEMLSLRPESVLFISKVWRKTGRDPESIKELYSLYALISEPQTISSSSKDFVMKALKVNPWVFHYLPNDLKADPEIFKIQKTEAYALALIKHDFKYFESIDSNLKQNPNVFAAAVKKDENLIVEKIKDDKAFAAIVVTKLQSIPQGILENEADVKYFAYEGVKISSRFFDSFAYHLYRCYGKYISFESLKELALEHITRRPTEFDKLDIKLLTSKAFMQKALNIAGVKPFAERYLKELNLSCEQLITDEDQRPLIIKAVENAQKLYSDWYHNKAQDETEGSVRSKPGLSFLKDFKLSWFRHGGRGQDRADNLAKSLNSKNEANLNKIEWELWLEIKNLLTNSKTRYHEHSYASFLIDELKKIDCSPFQNLNFSGKNNRYNRKEVASALDNFLKIREKEGIANLPKPLDIDYSPRPSL